MAARAPRIQIFSAAIGEGHDGPARQLTAGLAELDPAAEVEVVDFLALVPLVGTIAMGSSHFHSTLASWIFDAIFWLANDVGPTRRLMDWGVFVLSRRRLIAAVEAFAPDVVVSTYPGATLVLGELRARGRLRVPAVSAITDLAALRVWTHPAIDVNLITHPESSAEVRELAPASEIRAVSGFTSPGFERELDPARAREAFGLPPDAPVIVVSGGGWAVGDLEGAIAEALAIPDAQVVCLAGRNEEVRAALESDVRRGAAGDRASVHRPDRRAVRGRRRARPLDRGADRARGADQRLPGDLLRLGPRPRPGQQPRLRPLRPRPGGRGQGRAAGALERALAAPREPERALAELPERAASVYELAA